MKKPFLIGISGGSGSGKSTFVRGLIAQVEKFSGVSMIAMDSFYKDHSNITYEERCKLNFDHPSSIDFELFHRSLVKIAEGEEVTLPVYDFTTHTRADKTIPVYRNNVVVVDGILLLYKEAIRNILNLKLFIDVGSDIRFIRRLERDVEQRGRSIQSVIEQYRQTVEPMHSLFVEPTKRHADIIIPIGGKNLPAIEVIAGHIKNVIVG